MADQLSSTNPAERVTIEQIRTSCQLTLSNVALELNEAKTWLIAKSIVQNFLVNLWKSGKLAGAAPEEAFEVTVGLGGSMTVQDILENRMVVFVDVAFEAPGKFTRIVIEKQMQRRDRF